MKELNVNDKLWSETCLEMYRYEKISQENKGLWVLILKETHLFYISVSKILTTKSVGA
jgi:hypothetical protein